MDVERVVKYNICVRNFKNILPTFSTQFRLKFIYSEALNVPNITRCDSCIGTMMFSNFIS